MPDILLAAVEFGGYINPVKFAIFALLTLSALPLIAWVYNDAISVRTKELLWTAIVLAAAFVATLLFMLVPLFIVGLLIYLVVVAVAGFAYVAHRNSMVSDFDKILTADHIKGLFTNEEKKNKKLKNFVFVTANGNEVPVPQPRTPDFFGYKAAFDLFNDAVWRRAESITLNPAGENYSVTYNVDGVSLKQPEQPREQAEYFIQFAKKVADLDIEEKRKPQRGKFNIERQGDELAWQIATAGSTAGEQVLIRQESQNTVLKLSDLHLPTDLYEKLNSVSQEQGGLFIISGLPKSGITTTFYAMIRNHDAFLNSINTLEKQPSGDIPNVTQTTFSLSDTGVTTYGRKLQSLIRMAPDVVGAGECPDAETAKVVAQAAKDGKSIYIVLNAESTVKALAKWIKLVGDKNLALDGLIGISNQRLVRKLCETCKQAYEPNKDLLRKFNIPAEKAKVLYRAGKVVYDKHGKPLPCDDCQEIGFVGRMGIFEAITFDDNLRKMVKKAKSLQEISSLFRSAKMRNLQEQALRQVIMGKTAINEMVRIFSESNQKPKPKPKA